MRLCACLLLIALLFVSGCAHRRGAYYSGAAYGPAPCGCDH